MSRRTDTWQNGCFGKIDDHSVHITLNCHPPKMDILPKTFLKSSLPLNGQCDIQVHPQTSREDLCLPFCICDSYAMKYCRYTKCSRLLLRVDQYPHTTLRTTVKAGGLVQSSLCTLNSTLSWGLEKCLKTIYYITNCIK